MPRNSFVAKFFALVTLVLGAGECRCQSQQRTVRSEQEQPAQIAQLAPEIRKFMQAQPPLLLPNRQPGNAQAMFELSLDLAKQMGIKQPELFALDTTAEVVRRDRGVGVALPYFQKLSDIYVRLGDREKLGKLLVQFGMKQEVADSLKRRAQGTASQTSKQEGTSPTIKISSAVSKTKTLGDPIDLGGTIENTNPFAISHVEVQFLHVCTGETRTVTLFVNDKVPPRSVKEWQVAVTFREGHFPDALINILLGWKKAP